MSAAFVSLSGSRWEEERRTAILLLLFIVRSLSASFSFLSAATKRARVVVGSLACVLIFCDTCASIVVARLVIRDLAVLPSKVIDVW